MPSSVELGIDYSTSNILIYEKNKGIVFDEPSAIAYNRETKQIIAIGKEAFQMIGRTPENISAIRPLHSGEASEFEMAAELLRLAVLKVIKKRGVFSRPRALLALPISMQERDKENLVHTLYDAGMKKTQLIHKGVAACLGMGIKIDKHRRLVVDISGGTTDIMIISNRITSGKFIEVSSKSLDKSVSGDTFSNAIVNYFENSHSFQISMDTADDIKEQYASLYASPNSPSIDVWGRGKLTGMIQKKHVAETDIASEMIQPATIIVNFIQAVINVLNPQEALDVQNNGIYLTGGGAMLKGLDRFIQSNLQLKTHISYNSRMDTALGLGYALENPQEVQDYLSYARTGLFR